MVVDYQQDNNGSEERSLMDNFFVKGVELAPYIIAVGLSAGITYFLTDDYRGLNRRVEDQKANIQAIESEYRSHRIQILKLKGDSEVGRIEIKALKTEIAGLRSEVAALKECR